MKIIIVGAGLGGLTTYLHLRKHLPSLDAESIKIYDKHAESTSYSPSDARDSTHRFVVGGGLGIGPNGMRVIRHLSPELHEKITAAGFPVKSFDFRTSGNRSLATWSVESQKPTQEKEVMISWHQLWQVIRGEVSDAGVIEMAKKVVEVRVDGTVIFEDGQEEHADLVIGADGANSVCRRAVVDKSEGGEIEFQGVSNLGGFIPTADLPGSSGVVMTFGASGFFGYTPCNSTTTMWWSTYSSPTTDCPPATSAEASAKLTSVHGAWTDPVIRHIIQHGTIDLSIPTWSIPIIPRWSRGRVVLVSDAAHALPPSSGQGLSQAFEDVAILAVFLGDALRESSNSGTTSSVLAKVPENFLGKVFARYESVRKPRVKAIRMKQ